MDIEKNDAFDHFIHHLDRLDLLFRSFATELPASSTEAALSLMMDETEAVITTYQAIREDLSLKNEK